MNNKILIGSIIAICILIGVSFTSVVGYRSIESDVKASPLFNIRTSRAIDEDTNIQTCNYFGKGKDAGIPIPIRNSTYMLLYEIIDRITKMDKDEINKLIEFMKIHREDITDYENPLKNNNNIDLNEVRQVVDDINTFNKGNFTSNLKNPICYIIKVIIFLFAISASVIWVVFNIITIFLTPFHVILSFYFMTACDFVTRCGG